MAILHFTFLRQDVRNCNTFRKIRRASFKIILSEKEKKCKTQCLHCKLTWLVVTTCKTVNCHGYYLACENEQTITKNSLLLDPTLYNMQEENGHTVKKKLPTCGVFQWRICNNTPKSFFLIISFSFKYLCKVFTSDTDFPCSIKIRSR